MKLGTWPTGKRARRRAQRRAAWVSATVVATVTLGLVVPQLAGRALAPKPTATTTAAGYGFSTSFEGLGPAQLEQKMAALQAAGAKWLRFDLGWDYVQRGGSGSYDWAKYDVIVKAAARRGLKTLMIVDFTPRWARGADCRDSALCRPARARDYGAFAAAAARHYQPLGVEAWEIWNEPNLFARFLPATDPVLYVDMLRAAYAGIKLVDPQATVLAASTAPAASEGGSLRPDDFIEALYRDGAAGSFDALSVHPYVFPRTPATSDPADAWGQLQAIRATMVAHGDGAKRLWFTEFGAPTGGPPSMPQVSEAGQAQTLTEAAQILAQYSWSGPLFWYDYQDAAAQSVGGSIEDYFGLVRYDGSFKPAYAVFKRVSAGK